MTPAGNDEHYVRVENLITRFFTSKGIVKAIDDVSFAVRRGEIFGLVGESGCGKSVTATSIMDLVPDPPGRIISGRIYIDGFNILSDLDKLVDIRVKSETNVKIKHHKRYIKRHNFVLSRIRGKKLAMIFQEPFLALNPVITVGDQIMESIMLHERVDIANSIIRRETLKQEEIEAFVAEVLATSDKTERRRIINNWVRSHGLSAIERSAVDLFENQSDKTVISTEIKRLAEGEKTGLNVRLITQVRDYYKAQEQLLNLNLQLLSLEAEVEGEVKNLQLELDNLRIEYGKARSSGSQSAEELRSRIDELKKKIREASRHVDRSRLDAKRSEIRKLRSLIRRRFFVFSMKRRFLRRVVEKPFRTEARRRTLELLQLVNIAEPTRVIDSYPHELSGGMQQRVMIAMALASEPSMLIADEPTTALDVTTQAQILDLIKDLRKVTEASILFITHDLAVIAEMCDRVGVMYAGNLVEEAPTEEIFFNPRHPYTQGLLQAIPRISSNGTKSQRLESIPGSVPNLIYPPPGCRFHPRCPYKMDICEKEKPKLLEISKGHRVACWLYPQKEA
ncbi:MAG: ATP-binding cassette domain-containing protein [Methanomassiliicoccales archaeon]